MRLESVFSVIKRIEAALTYQGGLRGLVFRCLSLLCYLPYAGVLVIDPVAEYVDANSASVHVP